MYDDIMCLITLWPFGICAWNYQHYGCYKPLQIIDTLAALIQRKAWCICGGVYYTLVYDKYCQIKTVERRRMQAATCIHLQLL